LLNFPRIVRAVRRWPLAFSLAVLAPVRADADAPPPAERAQVYSAYERQTIDQVLASLHVRAEANPEGKIVETVTVVPLDVFEGPAPRSPWKPVLRLGGAFVSTDVDIAMPDLQWANIFHATTRRAVIRRELLLRPGEPFRQVLVDDTLRNLRRLPELSLVIVVATSGSAPDRVGIVVIAKDVWSLRASWDIVATPGGIEQFALQPTETNLFGTHQTVRADFIYEPAAYTVGLGYTIPRIDTSRIAVVASADAMINRASSSLEGSYGSVVAGEPIVSGLTRWSWDATVLWQDVVLRRYENAALAPFVDPSTGERIPFEYRNREYRATYDLTRSFGWGVKHDFTLSAGMDRNVYVTSFPGANPKTVADFISSEVPVSDTRVGPALQYHTYTKHYLRVIDFETLALQEDFGLGHDVVLRAAPSFRALGSTRDVISLYGAAQYTFAIRDGLARFFFASDTEPSGGRISDAFVQPGAHLVTPTVAGIGRIVVDGALLYRWRNYLNARGTLGGGDQLRGYPTSFFIGKDMLTYNVEVRSRPIEILSCQLAGVAFFDVGDAFSGLNNLVPYQSVGVGFRALFPQLDRTVFRGDIGFPIERPIDPSTNAPIAPYAFLLSFGQAFGVPTVDPSPVLPTGAAESAPTD
jgi:hypothetical protein